MVKRQRLVIMCAMALATLLPQAAMAQYGLRTPFAASRHMVKQKALPSQRVAKQRDLQKRYPMLCSVRNKGVSTTPNFLVSSRRMASAAHHASAATLKSPFMRTADGRELYGNVVYSDTWEFTSRGLYAFNANSTIETRELWLNDDFAANGGGAMVNGVFHAVNYFISGEYLYISHFAFDAETGDMTTAEGLDDISLIATETAVASDGTVYGQFYNAEGYPNDLGVIDYSTMTRSTIGNLTHFYVALGVTSDKTLYGVAIDGNLYRIDSQTAKETLVGPTGLTLTDSEGGSLGQSGEIDPKTNTFYWAAIDGNNYSALYTVDLSTGAASEVGAFPGSEQIYALTVPKPAAEDDAPAAIDDLALDFEGASLTGKVTFTAPTATFAGGELSGSLSYVVVADGDTLATGTTTAGATVEQEVTVTGSGSHEFVVTTRNDVGSSPKAEASRYIGYDQPYPVENLSLTSNSTTGEIVLSWTTPTGGYNDGFIGDLKYDVVRYPDCVKVAEGIAATTFSETLDPAELTAYSYGVVAINGDMQSEEVTSGTAVVGPAVQPPYDNDFADESSLNLLTIIDSNNDGSTWGYHTENQCAYYVYSMDNQGDDWLLTPNLKMEKGKEYMVTFTASNTLEEYPEMLEVKYGVGDDPTAFDGTLLDPTTLTSKREFVAYIVPTETNNVRIGFHAVSMPNMFNLLLYGVHVSAGASVEAPDSVAGFTVVPDAQGALKATVGFTVPTTTIGGAKLASVSKVEIWRNGQPIKTMTDGIAPGSRVEYTDLVDTDSTYIYKVVAYNGDGVGRNSVSKSVFVGTDVPAAVDASSIKVADNGTSLSVSWNAVTRGKNGGYVNPATMSYNLYDGINYDDFYGYEYGTLLDSVCGVTQSTIAMNTEEGDQQLLQIYIQPKSDKGQAFFSKAETMVTGESYAIPFSDGFDNGGSNYGLWWLDNFASSTWYPNADIPSAEGEPGVMVFDGCESASLLATGKINPAGANNLKLTFGYRGEVGAQASILVQVQKPDGTVDVIDSVRVDNGEEEGSAWTTKMVSLADYANERYIIVRFYGDGRGYVYLDDVTVRNVLADDLAASISAPAKIKKGQKGVVAVKVTNLGDNVATAYSVRLTDGNKVVDTKSVDEPLMPLESATVYFDYEASLFDQNTEANLSATVIYGNDQDLDNNEASATVALEGSQKPAPTSVAAQKTGDGIQLSWTAPDINEKEVTDGFEDYDAWTMDSFGDWTTFDGDKGYAGGIFNDGYGNPGETFAFEIMEPGLVSDEIFENNPELTPHNGDKYAAAVYSVLDDSFVDADNWLISPSLDGKKQTIKFYAMNQGDSETDYPETIQMLYTTAGTDTAEFVLVKTITLAESGKWQEVSFDVPAGATHFAIRHITEQGGYMLAIDDVTYRSGAGLLTGYNVYRDGQLVATVPAATLDYVDAGATDESCVYAVSAVYADGESDPVLASVSTAIDNVEANGQTFDVYTVEGKLVGEKLTTTKHLRRGVYVINGQKKIVK